MISPDLIAEELPGKRIAESLNIASLFSGIGGFELGFARAGHQTTLLCDIDPVAQCVLKQRFPATAISSDALTIDQVPQNTDLLCAGFPCQNLSMAGDKSGISGSASRLVDQVFRLIDRTRVRWVVFENVYFMLHLDRGRAMEHIVSNLERRKMRWAYRVLNTYWFGLPQRRRRVFLVAGLDDDPRNVILSDDSPALEVALLNLDRPVGFYWTEGRSGVGLTYDAIPPLKSGSGVGIASAPSVLFPDGTVETPTIQEAERLQGFPTDWTAAAEQVERRIRWRLVGNAVSVPVAEWIGKKLAHPRDYDKSGDESLSSEERWPQAAWGDSGGGSDQELGRILLGRVRQVLNPSLFDRGCLYQSEHSEDLYSALGQAICDFLRGSSPRLSAVLE